MAFLRGINLGRRRMKMAELREALAELGHPEARTLLASGNVVLEGRAGGALERRLEGGLEARFGYPIGVVLRRVDALRELVAADPFRGLVEDPDTKLYVTFLRDPVASTLPDPFALAGDLEVVHRTDREVLHVGHRQPDGRFGPGVEGIGKHFEPRTLWTMRNWNTVLKLTA